MRIIKAVCVGAGNRGNIYANFAISNADKLKIIGVVDPNAIHREEMATKHSIPKEMQFESVEDFIAAGVKCDLVINATMDHLHYKTAKPLLLAGYDMMLEKPVTADEGELRELRDIAVKNNCNLFICHLMRYTPFYKGIKKRILAGDIGRIVSVNMSEYVGVSHFIESFVVGKWRSEAECGSPFILAKSCHDLDILCWLNGGTVPKRVASFASRRVFIPENAPEGHTDTCHTCPCEASCKYSMKKLFTGESGAWKRIILDVPKPSSEVTQEDIYAELRKSHYGRCVYEEKDLVDRQNVIVEFEDGSIGTFDLIGSVAKADRYIRIVGENGEIFGNRSENKYTVRAYNFKDKTYEERVYDVSAEIVGGHSGGDVGMMRDVCDWLNGEQSSISMTGISDSVNGHLCVYAAEKARKSGTVVEI